MLDYDNSSVQNNSRLIFFCCCFVLFFLKDDRPQVYTQLMPFFKHTSALPFSNQIKNKDVTEANEGEWSVSILQ